MIRRAARALVPRDRRQWLREAARRLRHRGSARWCPVCGAHLARFLPNPRTGRPDSVCPVCGSQERHRATWPFLWTQTPLAKPPLRMLHVAPERCFERVLRRQEGLDYVTMDRDKEHVMVRTDLTNLVFEGADFDLILCNHVLEHVPDDRAAMEELFRVLRPGGCAVVTVPGPDPAHGFPERLERTVEDPGAVDPEARRRRFGHPEHVRQYGLDLRERLAAAGFAVDYVEYGRELSPAERSRRGVYDFYPIYACTR